MADTAMALISAGHGGRLLRNLGGPAGIEEPLVRTALERLLPPLARRLSEQAADPVERELLLDAVAEGGYQRYLDDPRALLGRDAIVDGEELLVHLYGSLDLARQEAKSVGPPRGLDADVFARMMTLAASLLLAVMARRQALLAGRDVSAAQGSAAIIAGLVEAVVRGFVEGTMRSLRPRRRTGALSRRRRWPRRRSNEAARPASIEALLGELLDARTGR